jgi:putative nucleotidyltransferase with HDIG domain
MGERPEIESCIMVCEYPEINFDLETVTSEDGYFSNEKINQLYDFSHSLVTTSSLDGLLDSIVHQVVKIIQVAFCRILTVNPDKIFECKAAYFDGLPEHKGKIVDTTYAQRIYHRVIRQNRPLVISRLQGSLSLDEGRALRLHHSDYLCMIPMRVNEENVGLLLLGDRMREFKQPIHEGQIRLAKLLADQSANAIHRARLSEYVQYSHLEIVLALAKAIDARDPKTGGHSKLLVQYAEQLADKLGCTTAEVQNIGLAALLHDIGKIGVPDGILKKPGPLSDNEWDVMRRHPDIGADIILSISKLNGVASIVRSHHEHYDGTGYPMGLKGGWIPLGSRILAVVDAYDAITSGRIYRAGRPHNEALTELKRCAGSHFDPDIVDNFMNLFE